MRIRDRQRPVSYLSNRPVQSYVLDDGGSYCFTNIDCCGLFSTLVIVVMELVREGGLFKIG